MGLLLARTQTSSSCLASSSMTAPRPMRSSWYMGMTDFPSTTEISTLTASTDVMRLHSPWNSLTLARERLPDPKHEHSDRMARRGWSGGLSGRCRLHGGARRRNRGWPLAGAGLAPRAPADLHGRHQR